MIIIKLSTQGYKDMVAEWYWEFCERNDFIFNPFRSLKFLNGLNIKSFLSLTKLLIPLSHHISMTLYPFSLLMVTTRFSPYVTLIKPPSSLKSLTTPSDMLHLILGASFLHHSGFLIQIIHPPLSDPSFEHAGLTCYTLLSPSITFSQFHSELKTYLFRKS